MASLAALAVVAAVIIFATNRPTARYYDSLPGWAATPGSSVVCVKNERLAEIFRANPEPVKDGLAMLAWNRLAMPDADCRAYRWEFFVERRANQLRGDGLRVNDRRR